MEDLGKFINDQLSVWPLAANNFRALKQTLVRSLTVGGLEVRVQFNPCRITSSTAEIDKATLSARPCFLCVDNRPKEQYHVRFDGRKGRRYNVQVNPYPIFPGHLVIARTSHVPQSIWHHLPDMLDFARAQKQYVVYYNGPVSGASAPDHLHYQACPSGALPLQSAVDAFLNDPGEKLASLQDASLYHYRGFTRGIYALKANTAKSMAKLFYRLLDCCEILPGDSEPRMNLYTWHSGAEYRIMVVLRSEIRSHHYYASGEEHLTISPGAAEMAGVFVAPVREDYEKVTSSQLEQMLAEVSVDAKTEDMIDWRLTRKQRKIDVGILSAPEIRFEIISDGAGPQKVSIRDGRIDYNGTLFDELYFDSVTRSTRFSEPSFILYDVVIGIGFHWQQKRDFKYAGSLKFVVDGENVVAINTVGIEDYLLSVISSEMKASSSLELLKAHAVISRSWVMKMVERHDTASGKEQKPASRDWTVAEDGTPVLETWFDQDDHGLFHVCADDHCQRYQGLTMATGENVRKAIDQTWGEVLKYGDELCDARFYKCCGGLTETFETCWEDVPHPYLTVVEDPFCDTDDQAVLSQVLNDYDLQTRDFHDWTVRYTKSELSEIFTRRSGKDVGEIIALEPLQRGPGGHICKLRVVGTKSSAVIGKELIIRKFLSESHLKSSNFEVTADADSFTLKGKAWGHGVGLCQIGAAVMGARGYSYKAILLHYYPGTEIVKMGR